MEILVGIIVLIGISILGGFICSIFDNSREHITSVETILGDKVHYDKDGNKIGYSTKNAWGGDIHYDAHGNYAGSSTKGLYGSTIHYDKDGQRIGSSEPGLFDDTYVYSDSSGRSGSGFTTGAGVTHTY